MTPQAPRPPERCGQRHTRPHVDGQPMYYKCDLAAGHRSEFHLDTQALATWSRAGDLELHGTTAQADARCRPSHFAPQHDACGARLTVALYRRQPQTWTCALGPHDFSDRHRAADGTQWRATDFPPTAVPVGTVMDAETQRRLTELERLAAPSEEGALNLGPIIERQRFDWSKASPDAAYASQADVLPLVREVMRLRRVELQHGFCAHDLEQMRAQRDEWRNMHESARPDGATLRPMLQQIMEAFAELRDFLCTGCRPVAASSNPEDGADLEPQPGCPVHGEVAELRRRVEWATRLHEQFCAALGPEYVGPFSADPTSAILRSIDTARQLDDVLRAAGIESPAGLAGVRELAGQRDGALEHVTELERHVDIVLELVADALPDIDRTVPLPDVIHRVITTYRERGDR